MFMTKFFKLALAGTMVLAAAACQTEQLDNTVTRDGVKEVTTQFVLNVAAAPETKMSANAVQMNHNFNGIDNAKLYVYATGMAPDKNAFVLKTSGWTNSNSKLFDLGTLYSSNTVNNTGDGDSNKNVTESSNRVLQLSIPVGTDAVLMYGKAIKGGNAASAEYGGTNMSATTFSANPSETIIAAQRILDTDAQVKAYDATAALMIYVINDILGMYVPETEDPLFGFAGSSYPVAQGTTPETYAYTGVGHRDLSWNALGHQYEIQTQGAASRYSSEAGFGMGRDIVGLEEVLGRCYYLFTYIRNNEYRTGSSGAIKRMIIDMYKVILAASEATPTNEYEANAKRLALAILDRAELYFDVNTGNYKEISTIKTSVVSSYHLLTETEWSTKFSGVMDLNGHPFEDFGIPRGAAQLAFFREGASMSGAPTNVGKDENNDGLNDSDVFYYLHPNKPLVNPNMTSFDPRKYMHPAELWYYVNSPIRTTSKSDLLTSDYPNGVNPWKADESWTAGGWAARGKVESSTRGVAVKNNINYGVALLKTTVALADDSYFDNRSAMTEDVTDREIAKANLNLELHGVLVGGVNPRMNWQFTRYYTADNTPSSATDYSKFDGVIYDSSIQSKAVPTVAGGENYTLVYDNYNSTGTTGTGTQADQNDVYIALEFKNNGDAFWGRDNLIPKDGYFYLVALIQKPTTAQISSLTWPTDHEIPPVYDVDAATYSDNAGKSKHIARVFMQDFMTSITFNLKQNSLKNAYYTMPDLRASQMSLGLSVDLQWTPGLSYDDIVL